MNNESSKRIGRQYRCHFCDKDISPDEFTNAPRERFILQSRQGNDTQTLHLPACQHGHPIDQIPEGWKVSRVNGDGTVTVLQKPGPN